MADWGTEKIVNCLAPLALGSLAKLQTRDYKPTGRFPIIDQGQSYIAGWTDDDSGLVSTNLPVIVFGDHTRAFKFVDFPFVRGADGTQVLKPRDDIDPLFFYYACQSIDLPARGYNRHFTVLKDKEIPIPSAEEQRDIGRILLEIDELLKLQNKLIAATEGMKRAATRDLFKFGLRGEAQTETDIGPVPTGWDVVEIGSVREWLQYGTSTQCSYTHTEFPVLRIPNIEPGRVNAEDIKYGNLSAEDAKRYRLADGDLIFIRTNGVIERLGTCAVYAGQPKDALFASYLIRARLKLDRINPYFAAQFFASERGTAIIAGRATPAADGKYNLNTGAIDSLPIPLPPTLDEQKEIVEVLDAIDQKIGLHQRKRTLLQELFRALLHKLMTSEVVVADLDLSALGDAPLPAVVA